MFDFAQCSIKWFLTLKICLETFQKMCNSILFFLLSDFLGHWDSSTFSMFVGFWRSTVNFSISVVFKGDYRLLSDSCQFFEKWHFPNFFPFHEKNLKNRKLVLQNSCTIVLAFRRLKWSQQWNATFFMKWCVFTRNPGKTQFRHEKVECVRMSVIPVSIRLLSKCRTIMSHWIHAK